MAEPAVGVVGLGAMGLPLAAALHDAGTVVRGHDVDAGSRERATARGIESVTELVDLVRGVETLVLSLPTPDVVTTVVDTIAGVAGAGTVVLDTSTIDPGTARAAADVLAEVGCIYADSPVLGRPTAVGHWTLLVGGPQVALGRARTVLAPAARSVAHVGDVGLGHAAKVINNMMLATINAVTAEALVLAEAAGLDPGLFVDTVVDSGAASVSGLFREVAPRAVDGDFAPTFPVRLMRKDNGLAIGLADTLDVPLVVATAAQSLTTMAATSGYADEDSIAVVRVLEGLVGRQARRR